MAYHPQGDGMVERFNRSLLQMLYAYAQDHADFMCIAQQYTPPQGYPHLSSCTVAPPPQKSPFPLCTAYDPSSYQSQLCAKVAQLCDFVETYITEEQHLQKNSYDHGTRARDFSVGDPVWLSIPTAGKLDPRWEGKCRIQAIPGPVTYMMGQGTGQYMSIACNITFSRTWKAPLSMQSQGRAAPLGELRQWSTTLLWTILSVNDGTPSVFGDHLTAYTDVARVELTLGGMNVTELELLTELELVLTHYVPMTHICVKFLKALKSH